MRIEEKLQELNIQIPDLPTNKQPFDSGVISGNTVILWINSSKVQWESKVYRHCWYIDISIEEAQDAARICTLNLLGALLRNTWRFK